MDQHLLKDYLKPKTNNRFSSFFTKVLIVTILLLSSLIYTSISDHNLLRFKKYVFEDTFNFARFNSLYQKLSPLKNKEIVSVSKKMELSNFEKYLDGMVFNVDGNYPVQAISSGIVIYIGKQDGYGNTVIIQGSDGFDIWYASLENINVKMYDYVKETTILGEVNNRLYLVINKDGKYYTYEEYQNKV